MVLPERGGKQQQQQLSHKESQWTRSERSVQESEMRRWRRKAPSISPSSASPLPAVLHARYAALGRAQRRRCATRATSRPRQAPPPLHRRSSRRAPDATLRRQLPHEPYPSAPPPCARVPSGRHAKLSAEPADGSQLAPPPPLAPPAARHRHPSHSTSLMRSPVTRVSQT